MLRRVNSFGPYAAAEIAILYLAAVGFVSFEKTDGLVLWFGDLCLRLVWF